MNTSGPVPLVLDLHIDHERFGSSSDPSINGHLHYPNDFDRPLNEIPTDKILQYRPDYKNRPSHAIAFMSAIASTSGRIRCEFVCLLFLQAHRETDQFLSSSGVNLVSIVKCSRSPRNPVYARRLDPSVLAFSLSLHRYPLICVLFSSHFTCCS